MGSTRAATSAGRRSAPARAKPRRGNRKSAAKPRPAAKPRAARRSTSRRPTTKPPAKRAGRRRTRSRAPAATTAGRAFGWRGRLAALALVVVCAAAGYMLWLRDSSLVAITDVEVVGVRSGDRERIVEELTRAAEGMTTLHVDSGELARIGDRFPTVASLSTDPNFPHGLRIEVTERPPAVVATSGGEQATVAADGSVLSGVAAPDGLPIVEVSELPEAGRLTGEDLEQTLVAGAAPPALAPLIDGVSANEDYGVVVELRGGIPVRFGDGSRVADKWAAAAAVLADPKLTALTYLDVRVPSRPTSGGG